MSNKDYTVILNSNEFDYDYYINNYNITEEDPILHYINEGVKLGYNPSKNFDTSFYLANNADVNRSNINPFVHYILYGKDEKRLPLKMDLNLISEDDMDYLQGLKKYYFPLGDENCELRQHYDYTFKNIFDYNKFNNDYESKKDFFYKQDVFYNFFVIPDKSIICKEALPFDITFCKRNIDLTNILDFSRFLNKDHYYKKDTRLNMEGNKIFSYQLIRQVDDNFDYDDFETLLSTHKLDKSSMYDNIPICEFNSTDDNPVEKSVVFEKPMHLLNSQLTDSVEYFNNKNSYSNLKLIVFCDDDCEYIKYYLSFYFREILICKDSDKFNSFDMINSFDTDYLIEIRSEKSLENYHKNFFNNNYEDINFNLTSQELFFNDLETNKKVEKTKISVIIPVYNSSKYLKACLDSVFNQTLDDFEVICVNDGSTDDSLNILKSYKKDYDNIEVISTENNGQGFARNQALKMAKGDYIYFLDSDDWININTLKRLYYKSSNEDLDLLFYQSINYLENTKQYHETDLDNFKCLDDHFGEDVIFNHNDTKDFIFEIPVNPVAKLYKRSFLIENDIKFPEGHYFEDNAFFYKVYFKCEKAGFLKEQLYNRRVRENSVTTMLNKSSFDIIEANNNIIKTFINEGQYEKYKKQLTNHTFDNVMYFFNRFPLELKYKFYEIMRAEFLGFNDKKDDFEEYLNKENLLIHNIIVKNKYYVDYLSEYKFETADYMIFDGNTYYWKDSEEYLENNKKYEISIIIPVYNNEKIIHRTLRSIINQSIGLDYMEVLLINDCSKDNTAVVLDDYARKYDNFKVIHINESTGAAGTPRNIGIKESNANYLLFLDHDDFFELNAIEKLYDLIIKNDVDVVYGVWAEIIEGKLYNRYYPELEDGYFKNLNEYDKLIAHPAPSIWTKLFKKDFLVENNILFPTILGEDAIFLSKALIKAKGIYFLKDEIICYHDLSDESTTNNVTLKYLTEGFVSEIYMFDYYKDLGKEQYYKYRTEGIIDFFIYQFLNSNLNNQETESIFDLFNSFCQIIDYYDAKPKQIQNRFIFDFILEEDLISTLEFKKSISSNNIRGPIFNKTDNTNLTDLSKENKMLIQKNKKLTTFKENVLNSRSWKLTGIFRKARNKIRM